MIALARKFDMDSLRKLATFAYRQLDHLYPNDTNWEDMLPTWHSRTHKRGLLGWGETRKDQEEGRIAQKKGSVSKLCRGPIIKAVQFYLATIAVPPTVAGESWKKAVAEGRYTGLTSPYKGKRKRLIPLQPPNQPFNLLEVFLLVVTSAYCVYLDPIVENGTASAYGILGFLRDKRVSMKLLALVKVTLHRLGNKQFLTTVADQLHSWIRDGEKDVRLKCIRELAPLDNETSSMELFQDMASNVVDTLVKVASGRAPIRTTEKGKNKYGFYPYGKEAGLSTIAFKNVPSSWFAVTLSELYPFLRSDKDAWPEMLKKLSHPLTALWPWATLRRHVSFHSKFHTNKEKLFKAYESSGHGTYHGPEPASSSRKRVTTASTVVTTVSDSSDDDESVDDDF